MCWLWHDWKTTKTGTVESAYTNQTTGQRLGVKEYAIRVQKCSSCGEIRSKLIDVNGIERPVPIELVEKWIGESIK